MRSYLQSFFIKTRSSSKQCSLLGCVLAVSLIVTGCSARLQSVEQLKNRSPYVAYETAQKAMKRGRYEDAIKYYEFITATYPFSPYAEQAHLDIIYAYYAHSDWELGVAASTRYIHLYPRSANVDYAYYMKGLMNFISGITVTQRYLPLKIAKHDLASMKDSFSTFTTLIHLFPHSRYAPDAYYRLIYIRNLLAEHELDVARYYYGQGADVAAANRASGVVKHFDGTPFVIPAMKLMIKAYRRMGNSVLANRTQRLLNYNYPRLHQYHTSTAGFFHTR